MIGGHWSVRDHLSSTEFRFGGNISSVWSAFFVGFMNVVLWVIQIRTRFIWQATNKWMEKRTEDSRYFADGGWLLHWMTGQTDRWMARWYLLLYIRVLITTYVGHKMKQHLKQSCWIFLFSEVGLWELQQMVLFYSIFIWLAKKNRHKRSFTVDIIWEVSPLASQLFGLWSGR